LNYIDGFAGPWQSVGEALEDTSPHIALRVLRDTRSALERRGRPELGVRAMFVEKDLDKHRTLEESITGVQDAEVIVRQGEFEAHAPEAVAFGSRGTRPFSFTFIDPCGWTGYGLRAITPLLNVQPGEVLINFMTYAINEWIDDPRPQTSATFEDLYGTTSYREAWAGQHGLEREEAMVHEYCNRIRAHGHFEYVVSAVILNPHQARSHYHLVYATRALEGLKTFRETERAALSRQEDVRASAQRRRRQNTTGGQAELFGAEALTRPYVEELRTRYHARARDQLIATLSTRQTVPFESLAVAAMNHPMTSEQDVRNILLEEVKRRRVVIDGLVGRDRTPQWNRGHTLRWIGA
jgi:three-Cys-motif partner protein